jgi:hypothetical protein
MRAYFVVLDCISFRRTDSHTHRSQRNVTRRLKVLRETKKIKQLCLLVGDVLNRLYKSRKNRNFTDREDDRVIIINYKHYGELCG